MKVAISGGDFVGLVAGHIMLAHGHDVTILENRIPLRSLSLPCFRYLEKSPETIGLLEWFEVVYEEYSIARGILIRGRVVSCRGGLTKAIHHAYWNKTRLTMPPTGKTIPGIVEPEAISNRKALTFDWSDLARKLLRGLNIKSDNTESFDIVIATRPLWEYGRIVHTDAMAVKLNLVPIISVDEPYIKWDLVYTPFTPCNVIHRIYHYESGYICEYSGVVDENKLSSDLHFLFPNGWHLSEQVQTTHGYLLPILKRPSWPQNVIPVGRLVEWNERITITNVIRKVSEIAKHGVSKRP